MKAELPRGDGHAVRACLCLFREDRPLLPWLHFGLHLGVVLGAEFVTMLLLGRPGRQEGPQIGSFFYVFFLWILGSKGEGGGREHFQ